jgi:hypothetical protein
MDSRNEIAVDSSLLLPESSANTQALNLVVGLLFRRSYVTTSYGRNIGGESKSVPISQRVSGKVE